MKNVIIMFLTTFVIIFPQFILKSYPIFADIIGIAMAFIVCSTFGLKQS